MPKSKPSQVVVHRIELQDKERELLENHMAVNGVAKVMTALPYGLAALGVGMAAYSAYWFLRTTGGWYADAEAALAKAKDNWNAKWEAATTDRSWENVADKFDASTPDSWDEAKSNVMEKWEFLKGTFA